MIEPPTGAVTFLFTDIEGSTRLVKQLRDRYGEPCWPIISGCCARPSQDIEATRSTRRATPSSSLSRARGTHCSRPSRVSSRSRPTHGPTASQIKVRMGLHTGQAVADDGRYTGLAVHRAARIGAAGTRGADPGLAGDADAARGRGGGSARLPSRSRRAAAQGPRPAGAPLPGGGRRAPSRVPAGSRATPAGCGSRDRASAALASSRRRDDGGAPVRGRRAQGSRVLRAAGLVRRVSPA